jgi:hypothetical protein
MKTVARGMLIAGVFLASCGCLSFLPVISVSKSAVVPPPLQHSSQGFASIQDLVGIFALTRVGVRYEAGWHSLACIAGLFAIGCLITALTAFLVIGLRPGARG